jgi:small multidrug resistance pump
MLLVDVRRALDWLRIPMMRSIDWTLWGLLLLAAALELTGDLAFKWWAETNRWLGLVLGLIVYALALIIFAVLLRRAELAVIFALWVGIATVLLALAGRWLFGEILSLRQMAGLALVVVGMILLQM